MKIQRKQKRSAELDMSAFSDIAFLLIIFFILTTTFIKPFGHKLDIPSGTSDASKKDQDQLTVNLKGDRIYFGEKGVEVDVDGLRARLRREKLSERAADKRLVLVECAKDVAYEHYFQVVMCVSREGGVLALLEEEETPRK